MSVLSNLLYYFIGLRNEEGGTVSYKGIVSFHLNKVDTLWLKAFILSKFIRPFIFWFSLGIPVVENASSGHVRFSLFLLHFIMMLLVRRYVVRRAIEEAYSNKNPMEQHKLFRSGELGVLYDRASGLSDNGETFFIKRYNLFSKTYLAFMPKPVSEDAYATALEKIYSLALMVLPVILIWIAYDSFFFKKVSLSELLAEYGCIIALFYMANCLLIKKIHLKALAESAHSSSL